MLKRLVNECRFTLVLTAKSPLLIKEGRFEKPEKEEEKEKEQKQARKKKEGKGLPDSIPIRRGVWYEEDLYQNFPEDKPGFLPDGAEYYLPGTSLRGVLRSHAERIVRTVAPELCCDPFQKQNNAPDQGCGFWMDNMKIPKNQAYAASCVICRLFGSTSQASRIRIADGDIDSNFTVGVRDHVGIDRFTGGVSTGPFQDLVLEKATFRSRVFIRNFELWQLGLLAYVVRDLACWEDGLIRLGYGKTKGYGLVEGQVEDLALVYYGNSEGQLLDLGDLAPGGERQAYDLKPGGAGRVNLLEKVESGRPYCTRWRVPEGKLVDFWKRAAAAWKPGAFLPLAELRKKFQGEKYPGEAG